MRKVAVFLLAIIIATILAGCSASENNNTLALVPQKANMLGQVNLNGILGDRELTGIYDRALKNSQNPQTAKEALDNLEEQNGIDLRDLREVILFADLASAAAETEYTGVIITGTFNQTKILNSLTDLSGNDIHPAEYRGYTLYSDELEEIAFVFASDSILVLGSMAAVKDVIDVKEGNQGAIRGNIVDEYNSLGDVLLKIVAQVPEDIVEEQLEQSEELGDLSAFADVKTVSLSMVKEQQSIALDMRLCALDADSADAIEQTLKGILAFIELLTYSEDPEAAQILVSLLEDLDISTSGSCVTINSDMTFSEIEDFIREGLRQIK